MSKAKKRQPTIIPIDSEDKKVWTTSHRKTTLCRCREAPACAC